MPRFSIIIPIYNVQTYIRQCIESVLRQSLNDFEIILVDDGSPDECPQICDEYALQDSRVIVIHKDNGGLSDARNAGTEIAKGEYILFIDSDDYWDGIDCLESINNAAKNNPDIILYRAKKLYDSTGKIYRDKKSFSTVACNIDSGDNTLHDLIDKDLFRCSAWSKATRLEILRKNNILFQRNLLGEDIDWYLNVVLYANSYSFVDRDFYVYRQREGSITKSFKLKNLTDLLGTITKWVKKLNGVKIHREKRKVLLKYLSKEYGHLFIIYSLISDKNKRAYKKSILELSWLFNYSATKRTKLIRVIFKSFGFNAVIIITQIVAMFKKRT